MGQAGPARRSAERLHLRRRRPRARTSRGFRSLAAASQARSVSRGDAITRQGTAKHLQGHQRAALFRAHRAGRETRFTVRDDRLAQAQRQMAQLATHTSVAPTRGSCPPAPRAADPRSHQRPINLLARRQPAPSGPGSSVDDEPLPRRTPTRPCAHGRKLSTGARHRRRTSAQACPYASQSSPRFSAPSRRPSHHRIMS